MAPKSPIETMRVRAGAGRNIRSAGL